MPEEEPPAVDLDVAVDLDPAVDLDAEAEAEGTPVVGGVGVGGGGRGLGRAAGWARRHRAVVVVLALLALAVAGLAAVRSLPPTGVPRLVVTADPEETLRVFWTPGPDGRPQASVRFAASATVRLATPERGGDVSVRRLSGPGITGSELPPSTVPGNGRTVTVPVRAVVDCDSVPEVVPPDAYGFWVEPAPESGRRAGVASAREPGVRWAPAVQLACATWRARRDLTVTAVTATVDPRLPRLAVTLTVANGGTRAGTVDRSAVVFADVGMTGALPVAVPPRGSTSVRLSIAWHDCARGAAVPGQPDELPDLTSVIGLAALSGPAPAGTAPFGSGTVNPGDEEGTLATGLVMARPAAVQLLAAIRAACGDLGLVVLLVRPGGVSVDRARGEVTVRGLLDLPRGRVTAVTLRPATGLAVPGPALPDETFRPTWTSVGPLVPDRTGQVQFAVSFRSAVTPLQCLPAFGLPGLTATLQVSSVPSAAAASASPSGVASTVVREVEYPLFLDVSGDTSAAAQVCA